MRSSGDSRTVSKELFQNPLRRPEAQREAARQGAPTRRYNGKYRRGGAKHLCHLAFDIHSSLGISSLRAQRVVVALFDRAS